MTTGLGRFLILFAGAALAIGVVWLLPLGVEEEPVSLPEDLGEKTTITLQAGDSVRRTIRVSGRPIKGVVVFSPAPGRVDGTLAVQLSVGGRLVAESRELRQVWRKDSSHLVVPLRPFSVPDRAEIELEIVRTGGDSLLLKAAQESGVLTMSLLHPAPLDFGTRQGVLVGVVFLLGAALVDMLPQRRWLAAGLLLTLTVWLGLAGFLFPTGALGISDWDYFFTVHEAYRRILFDHHSFPFWNPYACGGTAGLADPEFSVLSPLYSLEALFGVSLGLRLAAVVATTVGALGMLALGRRLRFSVQAALLAGVVLALSTTVLLKLVEGHVGMFAAMWVPWIFWAWHRAYGQEKSKAQNQKPKSSPNDKTHKTKYSKHRHRWRIWNLRFELVRSWRHRKNAANRWPLICGIFLALTFYQGGIHILLYLAPALAILGLLVSDRGRGLGVTWQAGLWALGLSAVKLFPVLLWARQFPDKAYAVSTFTLPWLHEVFLGRHLHGARVIPGQGGGWHEYGAYLGPLVLALALLACQRWRHHRVKLLVAGVIGTLVLSSLGPALKPLLDVVPYLPRSYTSRVVLLTVFGLALLAGIGLEVVRAWVRRSRLGVLPVLLVGVVAINLASLAYPLMEQAFVLPAVAEPLALAPAPLAFTRETHKVGSGGVEYDRAYEAARRGYGTLSYCSVLGPSPAVVPVGEPNSKYVQLQEGSGEVRLVYWSANRVSVQVAADSDAVVVLNTNYADGWRARGGEVMSASGRVAARVPAGQHRVDFQYYPPGLPAGLLVSAVTLLIAFFPRTIQPFLLGGAKTVTAVNSESSPRASSAV
jgi:hypothetical protein